MLKLTRAYTVHRIQQFGSGEIKTTERDASLYPAYFYTAVDNIASMAPAKVAAHAEELGHVFDYPAVTWIYTKCSFTREDAVAVAHTPEEIIAMIEAEKAANGSFTLRQQYAMALATCVGPNRCWQDADKMLELERESRPFSPALQAAIDGLGRVQNASGDAGIALNVENVHA